ncbi:carbohydrate ABC transporter permease [Paenibacillus sp. N3.4]|uniref:carbohydrate ABC transporter permease n=1 Tax=Paenibacillus sp. N3.4 TaxID=2603222 RepID=UPI0011C76AA7|nr:sugar ABC transporter permease [Paenibacillus sp. N3.4]TXK84153.1 sugar ABC transporter permease [Paenibacillus sp. N3.4]
MHSDTIAVVPQTSAKKLKKRHTSTNLAGYLFISPWLIGFCFLTLWPMILSLYYSFTDYSLLNSAQWTGFDNMKEIFHDRFFYNSLKVTFTFVLFSVPIKLAVALGVAMLLSRNIRGMSVYRTLLYLPSLIGGSVAVAVLWKNIFGLDGFINNIVPWFGIAPKNWIGMPQTALSTIIILSVWQFGSAMIIFIAGLKQIPTELYEASSADGAGKIRRFFHITLPMLSPVIFFNLVMGVIGSFQTFTSAFVITNGGPMNSTQVYAVYLYQVAFGNLHMGYASALAWILLLIVAIATSINFLASKYWVYDGEGSR